MYSKVLAIMAIAAAALGGNFAYALDDNGTGSVSEARSGDVTRGVFASPVTITPQIGALSFQDGAGNYTSRNQVGIGLDWNLASTFANTPLAIGLESGLLYSHLGYPSSNFLGQNSSSFDNGFGGANAFIVPLLVTAGYNISDRLLVQAKAGGQALYQSAANSINTGRPVTGDTSLDLFPSAGLNIGYGFSHNFGLALQGDWIPTPANDLYNVRLGATFGLG